MQTKKCRLWFGSTWFFSLGRLLACLLFLGGFSGCGPSSPSSTQPEVEKVAPEKEPEKEKVAPEKTVKPTRDLLDDRWEAIYLKGTKVGHGHTVRERIEVDGETHIRTTSIQLLTFNRLDQTTLQAIEVVSEDSEQGEALKMRCELSGASSLLTTGEVRDGILTLETHTQGKTATEKRPLANDTYGFFGLEDSLRRQPMQVGEERLVKWLQPVVNQVSEDRLQAVAEELVPWPGGGSKQLLRIRSVATLAGRSIESTLWIDKQGVLWKTSQPLGQEMFRTSQELAQAESAAPIDLVRSTIVKVSRALPKPHETKQVVYRATLKNRNPAELFPATRSQTVKEIDPHTAEIVVSRIGVSEPPQLETEAPLQSPPNDGDLAANNFIQSDDARVMAMAEELAGEATDLAAIALAFERGVHERVTEKNFSQAFATAAEVAQHLEGDCTEHAVLLAALLRARKIPARVVAGLVYYPPEQGFAYHMWNEAWLNKRWVPLDATLGRGGIGGGHLQVFNSNLAGSGAIVDFLSILEVMDQLQLEIVKAE